MEPNNCILFFLDKTDPSIATVANALFSDLNEKSRSVAFVLDLEDFFSYKYETYDALQSFRSEIIEELEKLEKHFIHKNMRTIIMGGGGVSAFQILPVDPALN